MVEYICFSLIDVGTSKYGYLDFKVAHSHVRTTHIRRGETADYDTSQEDNVPSGWR